jgi:hypothetical protein
MNFARKIVAVPSGSHWLLCRSFRFSFAWSFAANRLLEHLYFFKCLGQPPHHSRFLHSLMSRCSWRQIARPLDCFSGLSLPIEFRSHFTPTVPAVLKIEQSGRAQG